MEVLFVRMQVAKQALVTAALQDYYNAGWRVVGFTQDRDEYTFVLERAQVG